MPLSDTQTSLAPFHPIMRAWFEVKYGSPTDIQTKAWEIISEGEHALISGATGSDRSCERI